MSFAKDTVGKEELTFVKLVVERLEVKEIMKLFTIFPIGTIMQDSGKRSLVTVVMVICNVILFSFTKSKIRKRRKKREKS